MGRPAAVEGLPARIAREREHGQGSIMTGVLDGIRVLDFGRYIAGPYCATLLAE
jgi:crotonobetainyl-CoA:carnitine CoA-transferase CaiB-like acyl-CoA transferase